MPAKSAALAATRLPLSSARLLAGPGRLRLPRPCILTHWLGSRGLTTQEKAPQATLPLRKHLKDEAKRRKAERKLLSGDLSGRKATKANDVDEKWELTVGIEVHAELNTACKLFSGAAADAAEGTLPNAHVAVFDAAMPGSQPHFQTATLLPALRAAIALGCDIQRTSGWDRKHYFHWDQPNGYQITQYYRPFARDGQLVLTADDGVTPADLLPGADSLTIGIKQVQMEQDTAKTTSHGASTNHIDLNRSGLPLIEIITLPQIHSPQTAAAVVRKIQSLLRCVDACSTGMELGGLRADVNVSVRERGTEGTGASYSGVSGLGQRTEIKNLSSFTAVEKAVIAERDRQISVLEAGGVIEGETRGWSLGATETTRLRGKEGEVDYRYMPDPDLPPLVVGADLVEHLKASLPELPDATVLRIQSEYGISLKDARILVSLDDGDRLDYLEETIALLHEYLRQQDSEPNLTNNNNKETLKLSKLATNWVLHELGGLLTTTDTAWPDLIISPRELADLLVHLHTKQITLRTAKHLLATLHNRPADTTKASAGKDVSVVAQLIEENNLRLRPLSEEEYESLARGLMEENPEMLAAIRDKGQKGKVMWFVGQMVRRGEEGTVEPEKAREVVERIIDEGS